MKNDKPLHEMNDAELRIALNRVSAELDAMLAERSKIREQAKVAAEKRPDPIQVAQRFHDDHGDVDLLGAMERFSPMDLDDYLGTLSEHELSRLVSRGRMIVYFAEQAYESRTASRDEQP